MHPARRDDGRDVADQHHQVQQPQPQQDGNDGARRHRSSERRREVDRQPEEEDEPLQEARHEGAGKEAADDRHPPRWGVGGDDPVGTGQRRRHRQPHHVQREVDAQQGGSGARAEQVVQQWGHGQDRQQQEGRGREERQRRQPAPPSDHRVVDAGERGVGSAQPLPVQARGEHRDEGGQRRQVQAPQDKGLGHLRSPERRGQGTGQLTGQGAHPLLTHQPGSQPYRDQQSRDERDRPVERHAGAEQQQVVVTQRCHRLAAEPAQVSADRTAHPRRRGIA